MSTANVSKAQHDIMEDSSPYYEDGLAHIQEELQRLDLLIQRRVLQFRGMQKDVEQYTPAMPTYVSDQEVDWLLSRGYDYSYEADLIEKINKTIGELENSIRHKVENTYQNEVSLPLVQLTHMFGLSWLEVQSLIICIAPELRRSYDRIYAYLQDDITRKRPSIDLVLDLLSDDEQERWRMRRNLSTGAGLFRHNLLHIDTDLQSPSGSSGLARFLQLDMRILQYLLGNNAIDHSLENIVSIVQPDTGGLEQYPDLHHKKVADRLVEHYFLHKDGGERQLLFQLYGPEGVGKKTLALHICQRIGCPLLVVDIPALMAHPLGYEKLIKMVCRESLLQQASLYFENIECLFSSEIVSNVQLDILYKCLYEYGWLSFTAASSRPSQGLLPINRGVSLDSYELDLAIPDETTSENIWRKQLESAPVVDEKDTSRVLATMFRLTPGQIKHAVFSAELDRLSSLKAKVDLEMLSAGCRKESSQGLSHLATKVAPRYVWADLVLPEETKSILHSVCTQVRHQHQVFSQWGFAKKLAYGRGLSVMFSGSPGTGKTMAAQVMANDLQLDLYKIDLSGVVSKYIGETEKNLNRIFNEAEKSNAILFFDEADALFGKRTEVTDAHDRYANIEVSFLLQKIEEHNGIVILATNFRNNMDDAFVRRIRFIAEFPFPDQASRLKIWQKGLPAEAPLQENVDFDWLAGKIKVSGGSIKNIVLNAAFYAAEDEAPIDMKHMLKSSRLEFQKLGKLWDRKTMHYAGLEAGEL